MAPLLEDRLQALALNAKCLKVFDVTAQLGRFSPEEVESFIDQCESAGEGSCYAGAVVG